MTLTGLAFEAPGVDDHDWDDPQEVEQVVAGTLTDLGVDEPFSCWSGRTVPELPEGWANGMWEPR